VYSDEFKRRVVEYMRQGHSPAEACREFMGPAVVTVYLWMGYKPKRERPAGRGVGRPGVFCQVVLVRLSVFSSPLWWLVLVR
jgi:hypothetical protein